MLRRAAGGSDFGPSAFMLAYVRESDWDRVMGPAAQVGPMRVLACAPIRMHCAMRVPLSEARG